MLGTARRECIGVQGLVAEPNAGRMREAAPGIMHRGLARAGFGDRELAGRGPCCRRLLRQQHQRINPGDAHRRGAAAHAVGRLQRLVGQCERGRSLGPAPGQRQIGGAKQIVHRGMRTGCQRRMHTGRVECVHALFGNPVTQVQRHLGGAAFEPGVHPVIQRRGTGIAFQRINGIDQHQSQGAVDAVEQGRHERPGQRMQYHLAVARRAQRAVQQAGVGGERQTGAVEQEPGHRRDFVMAAELHPGRQRVRLAIAGAGRP